MFKLFTRPAWAVPVLLSLMGLNCLLSLSVKSPTVDEFAHLPAGYYYWKTGDFSLYAKNPPLIRLLCALPLLPLNLSPVDTERSYQAWGDWRPWMFGTHFMRENAGIYDRTFFLGRLPVVFLTLLLGWYVFRWAKELYGPRGGLLSLLLYSFSPNMLAHGRLVTTDVGLTCFMFMAVYYYWRSFYRKGHGGWIGAGICLGLSMMSKFTSLLLLPIFALLLLIGAWNGRASAGPFTFSFTDQLRPVCLGRLCDGGLRLFLIVIIALLMTNLGYGFKGSLRSIRDTTHESRFFEKIAESPLGRVPIPLPRAYLEGLDQQKLDAEEGEFLNYLRGRFSTKGWWYYFLYAFLVKTPIALHVVILICVWLSARKWGTSREDAFLIIPIFLVFFAFSFFNQLQVGLRYVLPAFPFLFVWVGRLGRLELRKPALRWGLALLLLGYVVSSVSVFPDYLAYFNGWAGGPGNGHRHLLDSNLDWGQDLKRLKGYMDQAGIRELGLAYFGHVDPEICGIRHHLIGNHPESGDIAISANYLYGLPYLVTYGKRPVPVEPGAFRWLHRYKAKAHVGHSILIYAIPRVEN